MHVRRSAAAAALLLLTAATEAQSIPELTGRRDFPTGGRRASAVAADDFDGDGWLDLAVALTGEDSAPEGARSDRIVILRGDPTRPGELLAPGPVSFDVGVGLDSDPIALLALQLEGGPLPDLVSANNADDSVSVVVDGQSVTTRNELVPRPVAVAGGDFDGDGTADFAVLCDSDPAQVVLFLREGSDYDVRPVDLEKGSKKALGPTAMVATDATGDAYDDLLITVRGAETPDPKLWAVVPYADTGNPGDVQFSLISTSFIAPFGAPVDLAVGDFDGNGRDDYAVAFETDLPEQVRVLIKNGPGITIVPVDVNGSCAAVDVADFDGDGQDDIVVSHTDTEVLERSSFLSVALQSPGPGVAFEPASDFFTALEPRDLAVGDFDQAEGPDVAAPSDFLSVRPPMAGPSLQRQPALVSLHRNQGSGAFRRELLSRIDLDGPTPTSLYEGAERIRLGQFDPGLPSGPLDAVTVPIMHSELFVGRGRGDGTFDEPGEAGFLRVALDPCGGFEVNPRDVSVGDLDGDGDDDLVAAVVDANDQQTPVPCGLTLLVNEWPAWGAGADFSPIPFQVHPTASAVAGSVLFRDFDGDGRDDVAVGFGYAPDFQLGGVTIFLSSDEVGLPPLVRVGTFDLVTDGGVPIGTPHDLELAHLDGDPHPDLMVCLRARKPVGTPGDGSCSIGTGPYDSGGFAVVRGRDPSGDGIPFVLDVDDASITMTGVRDARNVTAGHFSSAPGSEDLLDVAIASKCNDAAVVFANVNGSFEHLETHPVGNFPNSIESADLDGDGLEDLALACYHSNTVALLLQRVPQAGETRFLAPIFYGVSTLNYFLDVGDLNGDGLVDVVSPGRRSDDIATLLGLGP